MSSFSFSSFCFLTVTSPFHPHVPPYTIHKYIRKFEAAGNARKHLDSGSDALHGNNESPIIWIIWKLLFPSFIFLTKEVMLQIRPRAGWGRGSAFLMKRTSQ